MEFLIVEDDPATSELLAEAVRQLEVFSALQQAYSLTSATRLLAAEPAPGMLLCDLGLPDGDGLKLVSQASDRNIPVIVISARGDETTVVSAIELGASGYLHKGLESEEINRAIAEVLQGGSPLSPTIAIHLLRRLQPNENSKQCTRSPAATSTPPLGKLTGREIQILQLIARGYLLSEVACELKISPHTVSNHNRNIYRKLSARSRTEAVFNALSSGIISAE